MFKFNYSIVKYSIVLNVILLYLKIKKAYQSLLIMLNPKLKIEDFITGAGVIPYAIDRITDTSKPRLVFLFHTKKAGKKSGTLIDFGGSIETFDNYDTKQCAAREFCEETAAAFFIGDKLATHRVSKEIDVYSDPEVKAGTPKMLNILQGNNVWHLVANKEYHLYIAELPYIPAAKLDMVYYTAEHPRRFVWLTADELAKEVVTTPLFIRILIIKNLMSTIKDISVQFENGQLTSSYAAS